MGECKPVSKYFSPRSAITFTFMMHNKIKKRTIFTHCASNNA